MTYTFWHSGILIGESDLEEASGNPGQRGGVFRPTAYGLEVFPRLSGILSAGNALKNHLDANGLDPEALKPDEIDELLDNTPAGRQIIDVGRMLSDVEMRAPDGRRLEFKSIAFSDLLELKRLARELQSDAADALSDLPPDAPRYLVSATLRSEKRASKTQRRGGRLQARGCSGDN
jgi:hypothetical protein